MDTMAERWEGATGNGKHDVSCFQIPAALMDPIPMIACHPCESEWHTLSTPCC